MKIMIKICQNILLVWTKKISSMGKIMKNFFFVLFVPLLIILFVVKHNNLNVLDRELTTFENILLTIISIAVGILGSYYVGKKSSVQESLRPVGRSAFRRAKNLYLGLNAILEYEPSETISALIQEQIRASIDIMEEWQDLVPEELEDLLRKGEEEDSYDWN